MKIRPSEESLGFPAWATEHRQLEMIRQAFCIILLSSAPSIGLCHDTLSKPAVIASLEEMKRLTATASESRNLLGCAALSSELNMPDMYSFLVNKASKFSDDGLGMMLAIAFMSGVVQSELLHLKADSQPAEYGQAIGMMYRAQCLKFVLPGDR